GQQFSFYSDASDEEVQETITMLREELDATGSAGKNAVPSSTQLVLGALRLAARYVDLEKEFSIFHAERKLYVERKQLFSGLIDRVSSVLDE
ncbi:MAG: cell division protein ZapA, partial [Candidatus Electrothrix sp. AR4]|nr:cell division protein ZapA [Candidatus Electrothrix sp. AR4]